MNLPLFVSPLATTAGFLAMLFCMVVGSMFVISRFVPVLSDDAHPASPWLDGLRGFAAVLVSLNHAPFALIDQGLTPKVFYFPLWQHDLFRTLGATGVQIFFCITGVLFTTRVLNAKSVDWSDFFRKRLRRIVPAYFVAATLAIAVTAWVIWPNPVDPEWFARAVPAIYSMGLMHLPKIAWFNMEQLLGVSWTLGIEWTFYMLLPIVYVLVRRARLLTMAAIIVLALGDTYLTGASSWAFFVIGFAIAPLSRRTMGMPARVIAHVGIVAAVAWMVTQWKGTPDYGIERFAQIALLMVSVAIAKPWALKTRVMLALGTVSYSFYLLHLMAIYVTSKLYQQYFGDIAALNVKSYGLLAGGSLIVAVCAASASYVFVERPFTRGTKRPAAAPGAMPTGSNALEI